MRTEAHQDALRETEDERVEERAREMAAQVIQAKLRGNMVRKAELLLLGAHAEARLLIVEPHKDAPGQLHAYLLAHPLAVPAFVKSIVTDAAHADWLGEAVKATPELAEITDADGRHAFAFAHLRCKQVCERYSNLRR